MKTKTLFAALSTLLLVTTSYSQTLDSAKLDQFLNRLAEKNKAMGSLTIAKEGKVLYTRAFGFSQITATEKKPMTAANRFRIGSITKMFTATMILELVEEGKLKLSDTLDKFFPQIPNAQKITINQILAHRSGIHDAFQDRSLRPSSKTDSISKDELVSLIAKGKPDFEPDAKHSYSNSGYTLLGLIIEKVTGKSYAEALKEKITSKIGLMDTYSATGSIDVNNNEALTYRYFADWKQDLETHPSLLFGSGAIVSTPSDLAKFIQALFNQKLVSQQTLALMKTMRDDYGLGMTTFTFAGKTFYGHTGGADNYGAWLAYLPEEKLAVAYATNAKVYSVEKIVSGVIDIFYNRPFEIPSFESIVVSVEVLDQYVGVYSSPEAPIKFTISREGTILYVQPGGQSAAPLEATAQDKFRIESAGIVFQFDAAKRQMTIKRNGSERIFTKEKRP
jgi:D-alanyl-D-alanine carboxypeptidase